MIRFSRAYPFDFPARRKARLPIALPRGVTIWTLGVEVSRAGWTMLLESHGVRYTKIPCELVGLDFPLLLPISVKRLLFTFLPPEASAKGRLRGMVFLAGTQTTN